MNDLSAVATGSIGASAAGDTPRPELLLPTEEALMVMLEAEVAEHVLDREPPDGLGETEQQLWETATSLQERCAQHMLQLAPATLLGLMISMSEQRASGGSGDKRTAGPSGEASGAALGVEDVSLSEDLFGLNHGERLSRGERRLAGLRAELARDARQAITLFQDKQQAAYHRR